MYQNHERADFSFSTSKANNSYQCNVNSCESKFMTLELLLKHLKRHISNGSTIKCPFLNCTFEYKKLPSFTSHISRNHINKGQSTESDTVFFESENIVNTSSNVPNISPNTSNESASTSSDLNVPF